MSQALTAPLGLWQMLPNTILVKSQHPSGASFMPASPVLHDGGVVAFPASVEAEWLGYITREATNRIMLDNTQHALYVHYLQNPDLPANATADMTRNVAAGLKHRVVKNFFLDGSEVYRKSNPPKQPLAKYMARTITAFRIIANVHSQLNHQGITKTHDRIKEGWYGITEENVKWVLKECGVCILDAPQVVKAPPMPIVSARCMDRVQIDLVDHRSKKDGEFCWLLQIKDCFSNYIWLHALKNKGARDVAERVSEWIGYCGAPRIL